MTRLPCDPVTFEILRHKLHAVIDEAIIALENVSGSPITNEGHDMMVSLYRRDGSLMVGGVGYLYHLTSASQAVKHILRAYLEDPGIERDDIYLLNDPYTAALHPPDMYVISPIHWEDELVGFVANFVHLTDVGAISPGGFCPDAVDTYQEGFVTQGLKLADRGRVRRDVLDTILNNVRDPAITGLDLRSQMAANHTAKDRMQGLYEEYGVELVDAVADALIEISEEGVRRRLSELPDGEWRARQYVDLPDGLKRVDLVAEKSGDSLVFDLEGTEEQSRVGVNATYWGAVGGVFGGVFPLLAWDVTWNDGVIRPIDVRAPLGSLANCEHPAPISIATIGIIKVISSLASAAISKMLGSSDRYSNRVTATWKGTHMNLEIFGRRTDGEYFVTLLTDSFAGSGGARATCDGVDLGGEISNQVGRWANAESQESRTPLLYLFREPIVDSGGPGRFRGGVSHAVGLSPHNALGGALEIATFALGSVSPFSQGIMGGYPGSHVDYRIHSKASLDRPVWNFGDLGGGDQVLWGHFMVESGDVLCIQGVGGGGYGDPIERDPLAVLVDVRAGLVSERAADRVYGVIFEDGAVDKIATRLRRVEIRHQRIGSAPSKEADVNRHVPQDLKLLSEYVGWSGQGHFECTRCGEIFGDRSAHWKKSVSVRLRSPEELGSHRPTLSDLVLHEFCCPGCGTLLDTDLVREGDEPLYDAVRSWVQA